MERAASAAESVENEENDQDTTDSDDEDTESEEASEAEDDRGNNSVRDDDSSDSTEEEMDEEEYDILHKSNQKTRHNTNNDGIFVEELENIYDELPELAEEQNADEETGEDDVGQEEGDVSEDSQSQNTNDDNIHGDELSLDHRSDTGDSGPRRSTRIRTEPERLKPTLLGKSYIMQSIGTKLKRHIKKDLNIRAKKKPRNEHYNLFTQGFRTRENCYEYTNLEAMVMAQFIAYTNERVDTEVSRSFSQQHQLKKGLKLFGDRGHKASAAEMEQLHVRECFKPLAVNTLSQTERKRAQIAMMLLTEKRCGKINRKHK